MQPLKCGLSYIAQKHVELGGHERKKKKKRKTLRRTETGWEEKPKQLSC